MSKEKPLLITLDAQTLLATPIEPVQFIVEGLLPPGLHLLGGSPKVGKSWLMLWLCLQVAGGLPVWELRTQQCGALYLCLEDTYGRIQTRLFEIADTAPRNLHFAIMADRIDEGLEQQIEEFLQLHEDTRLVVIDTLQRVRGADMSSNAYANDYRAIVQLKSIADKHSIALIVVHHLRKQSDKDPFMKVSGTTGLTGGVDSTFVLEKDKRSADTAKLFVTGRDVEYQELTLKFEHCVWQLVSRDTAKEVFKREIPDILFQIVDFMKGHKEWQGSATALLAEISDSDTPHNTVTKILNQYHSTVLAENRIIYRYNRTGKGRLVHLISDGCDGYDSDIPTADKPSQPSSTVTTSDS